MREKYGGFAAKVDEPHKIMLFPLDGVFLLRGL